MKTRLKVSIALLVVLATLIPLSSAFYASKQAKINIVKKSTVAKVAPVLGPVYNETIKAAPPTNTSAPPTPPAAEPNRALAMSSGSASRGNSGPAGSSPVIGPYTATDVYWLAKMVYAEASGEPYQGQVAVAAVILNRVASPKYPNSVKGVLFQVTNGVYQFSPVANGAINRAQPNATTYKAVYDALAGSDPSKGALLYYNPKTSTSQWIKTRPITVVIGHHNFAR